MYIKWRCTSSGELLVCLEGSFQHGSPFYITTRPTEEAHWAKQLFTVTSFAEMGEHFWNHAKIQRKLEDHIFLNFWTILSAAEIPIAFFNSPTSLLTRENAPTVSPLMVKDLDYGFWKVSFVHQVASWIPHWFQMEKIAKLFTCWKQRKIQKSGLTRIFLLQSNWNKSLWWKSLIEVNICPYNVNPRYT